MQPCVQPGLLPDPQYLSVYSHKLYLYQGILFKAHSYTENFSRYLRTNQLNIDKVLREDFNAIQYYGAFRFQQEQDLTLFLLKFS